MQYGRLSAIVVGIGMFTIAVGAVQAHHALSAEFDANKPVRLQGTVTKMLWINPHTWIHLDVKRPDGTVEEWMIEGGAPNSLLRRGWTKTSLSAGAEVIVEGYQAYGDAKRANGRHITFTDGRKLFVGSVGIGAPDEADGAPKP
jgi:hypothetical protein